MDESDRAREKGYVLLRWGLGGSMDVSQPKR